MFFDIITTLSHSNFTVLEGNPVVVATGGFMFVLLLKLCINLFLVYSIWKTDSSYNKTNFSKFFYLSIFLLLFIAQVFAGYSNIKIKNHIREQIEIEKGVEYHSLSHVPTEEIKKYTVEPYKAVYRYFQSMFLLYFPVFFSCVTFKIWEKLYL